MEEVIEIYKKAYEISKNGQLLEYIRLLEEENRNGKIKRNRERIYR